MKRWTAWRRDLSILAASIDAMWLDLFKRTYISRFTSSSAVTSCAGLALWSFFTCFVPCLQSVYKGVDCRVKPRTSPIMSLLIDPELPTQNPFLSRAESTWMLGQTREFHNSPYVRCRTYCYYFRSSILDRFYSQFPFRHPQLGRFVYTSDRSPYTVNQARRLEVVSHSWQEVTSSLTSYP